MSIVNMTRRGLLRTAGVGASVLAMPAIARAAPTQVNIAFFLSTSPSAIAKGEGWIDEAAKTKVNWIEVGSGARNQHKASRPAAWTWGSALVPRRQRPGSARAFRTRSSR